MEINWDQIKVEAEVGLGATATVFKVTYNNQTFALKRIPIHSKDVNPSVVVQEIKTLFQTMECKYIVRLYDACYR